MSLRTHSQFYYGHVIDANNLYLDFDEGGPEISATLTVGSYTLTDFITEVERALNAAGGLVYTVTVNRATRIVTIAATGSFNLLVSSGVHAGGQAYNLLGFTGADQTGAATYSGDSASGSKYSTQFILQSHIPSTHFVLAAEATVNKSASGRVEVFSYGEERFIEMNFRFITDTPMPNQTVIRTNLNGVDDFLSLFEYFRTKGPFEYMEDESIPATFEKVILESTPDDTKGVGFKLKELYDLNLPGFFESGILRLRVVA